MRRAVTAYVNSDYGLNQMLAKLSQNPKIKRARKRLIYYAWTGFLAHLIGGILIYLSTFFDLVAQSIHLINVLTLYTVFFYTWVILAIATRESINRRFSQKILVLQIANSGVLLFFVLVFYPEIKHIILVLWIMAFAFTFSFGNLKQSVILSILIFVFYLISLGVSGLFDKNEQEIMSELLFLGAFIPTCAFISYVGAKLKKQRDNTQKAKLQLEETLRTAAAANESKSAFLANMSHEIRTPMNAIINLSYLCLQSELEAKQRNYVEKVNKSAKSLLQIINDILDFSKVEAGKLHIEQADFALDEMLAYLAVIEVANNKRKNLQPIFDVQPGTPTLLRGDLVRINQVLLNLLSNAIKFTKSGQIVLSVRVLERRDKQVVIKFMVRDSGIGMPQSVADKMFEPFSQADTSTTRVFGGTGLGLVICKQLTELMGGRFELLSEPGRGTRASAVLPLGLAAEPLFQESTPATNKQVLLAAQDEVTLKAIQNTLSAFAVSVIGRSSLDFELDMKDEINVLIIDESFSPLQIRFFYNRWPQLYQKGITAIYVSEQEALPPELVKFPLRHLKKPVYFANFCDVLSGAGDARSGRRDELQQQFILSVSLYQQVGKQRILLAEDNELNQEIIADLLDGSGCELHMVENGLQVLELLEQQEVDVILMDIQMPVMDGIEVTRRIRATPKWRHIPIIALTASAIKNDMEQGLAIGMNEYLTKPIIPKKLFAALIRCCTPKSGFNVLPFDIDEALRQKEQEEEQEQEKQQSVITRETKTRETKAGLTAVSGDHIPAPEPAEAQAPDGDSSAGSAKAIDFPGLDIEAALRTCNGKEALFRKLIAGFAEKFSGIDLEIRQALAAGESEQAKRLAHNLRGISANIGALSLAEVTASLEQELAGKGEVSGHLSEKFKGELQQVLDSISCYLEQA
ncbi:response regulator [Thalassomonas viridans]|uniref:Sensory/regulatory protein RpfC n=1 Tax=Thalassomonas viridans TaxID=137584 RepID=A0AAE9YZB7_9GAMM|nr:response regulator [Thalassomonas viridans]WDE03760.1 response regulator [Thalassomonas viridans]